MSEKECFCPTGQEKCSCVIGDNESLRSQLEVVKADLLDARRKASSCQDDELAEVKKELEEAVRDKKENYRCYLQVEEAYKSATQEAKALAVALEKKDSALKTAIEEVKYKSCPEIGLEKALAIKPSPQLLEDHDREKEVETLRRASKMCENDAEDTVAWAMLHEEADRVEAAKLPATEKCLDTCTDLTGHDGRCPISKKAMGKLLGKPDSWKPESSPTEKENGK